MTKPKAAPVRAKSWRWDRARMLEEISNLQNMLATQDNRTREVEGHRDALITANTAAGIEQREKISTLESANRTLEKRLEESRLRFGDLKERLYNAELMNSRMQGYIDRVASDDVANDEPVQVGERTLMEVQPRRPRPPFVPLPQNHQDGPSRSAAINMMRAQDGHGDSLGGTKIGHWTSW